MTKNRQYKTFIISLVTIFAVTVVVSMVESKRAAAPADAGAAAIPNATATLDWSAHLPQIRAALKTAFPGQTFEDREPLSILQTADITGDGVPEALVDTGTGGASTDLISVLQVLNGSVTVANYKGTGIPAQPVLVPQGSAELHASDIALDPSNEGFYVTSVDYNDNGTLADCALVEYRWNDTMEEFDENPTVSAAKQPAYCATIPKSVQ